MTVFLFMVKSFRSRNPSGLRGGMAERLKAHVLKTCLGHTNVGSNPTPSARRFAIDDLQIVNLQAQIELGRCQSGRMGPPAKRLPGRNLRSQVRILSSPLQEKNASITERVFHLIRTCIEYRMLIQTQFHSQVCTFESQAFVKSMRVCA